MAPHLRWPGHNNKSIHHYFVFASVLEFPEIRLLDGIKDSVVDDELERDHRLFIDKAKNLGLTGSLEKVPRNYKYFHIVLNLADFSPGLRRYECNGSIQDLYHVNILSPLLAIPDEFMRMFMMFLDRYKPIKNVDCSLEDYALLGNRPAHWKAH